MNLVSCFIWPWNLGRVLTPWDGVHMGRTLARAEGEFRDLVGEPRLFEKETFVPALMLHILEPLVLLRLHY